ncbi:MAG: hypothetical protein COU08_00260 [Candidatus Harrisonbacteria bacterium CG10_big_fil_rev_8_21_14_0_10_42_17]|uniref:Uncharacterized protein n=1 Tax=Candidatus Harrisonbacteria bacterium CG10_big_fil_rev_8_21_14_0_10_42_17 TaxID=1974584 RepID=A0A2M6WJ80_9BACT|nr:MAG: hypothetical protein COU08_00260 [Candidatus Harrisonbacteria bacterium CG10_big_fil_rev_8_21_14_0_10_42_17]
MFLLATKNVHSIFINFYISGVTTAGLLLISAAGLSVFYRAEQKITRINKLVHEVERKNKRIAEIIV